MPFSYDISFLVYPIAAGLLFVFIVRAIKSPEPSGPVAVGRALAVLLLSDIFGSKFVVFAIHDLQRTFRFPLPQAIEQFAITAVFCLAAYGSGYIAAKTMEDTHSMNYKIICVIGVIPHGILSFFFLSGGIFNHLAFWSFIPLVVIGGYVKSRDYLRQENAQPL